MIITQNGEAKIVVQDIESFEETQEVLAMLKLLALGTRQIENNEITPAELAIQHVRQRRSKDN